MGPFLLRTLVSWNWKMKQIFESLIVNVGSSEVNDEDLYDKFIVLWNIIETLQFLGSTIVQIWFNFSRKAESYEIRVSDSCNQGTCRTNI